MNITLKEIIDEYSFTINETIEESEFVFVYGHKIDDFKVVNKDAIFTVGIGALQEVDRQLQAEKQAHLETKEELTLRIQQLESRLSNFGIP